jgi:hypothetical protein
MAIHSAKQVHPLASNAYKGFIHVPGRGLPFDLAVKPTIDFRAINLDLSPNGRMVNDHAALRPEFVHIAQT